MRGAVGLLCALAAVLPLTLPSAARADLFGPISLVSQGALDGGPAQQFEYAHDAAISGDGTFIVFDGSIAGVTGVWRRELRTGALEQVAGGDAEMPSVSADGQYVSFTTNEGATLAAITDGQPDAAPTQEAVNVYVRNMALAPGEAGAFTVASAPTGSSEPLTYEKPGTTFGASAAPRSAISAEGNEVAFVTTAVSNLVPYPQLEEAERQRGETPKPHTPPDQVAVRYLESGQTVLVGRCYYNCAAAAAGAAEPVVGSGTLGAVYPGKLVAFPFVQETGEWPGASLSADGSTVAWMGEELGEQVPALPAETFAVNYTEPLWRRIAPGSETPTERVTGGSEPTNPLCVASGESALPGTPSAADPCQGPFATEAGGGGYVTGIWGESGGVGDFIPRLSADGYTVAFLSEERLLAEGADFGRGGSGQPSDLFVADMHPGLTRVQALAPLTEIGPEKLSYDAAIADFEISADGAQVAFATARTQFPLGFPQFGDAPAPEPGMPELFDVDLRNGTLVRVTHGYAGGPSEQPHGTNLQEEDQYGPLPKGFGALSPSFSADGGKLVFTSTADNLVYGDGNTPPGDTPSAAPANGGDVFLVEPIVFPSLSSSQSVSPAPTTGTEPLRRLGVTALARADGTVVLYVAVPSAGTLTAAARGAVLVRATAARAALRRAHAPRRRRPRLAVATRTLASARAAADAPAGEPIELVLRLDKAYAALAAQPGGLSANVSVTFRASGAPPLRETVAVTFRRTAVHAARHAAARSHGRPRR